MRLTILLLNPLQIQFSKAFVYKNNRFVLFRFLIAEMFYFYLHTR